MTLKEALIAIGIFLLLMLGSSEPAYPSEPYATLQIKYHNAIAWRNHVPEPIPLSDCKELALKLRLYFDRTMGYNHPEVRCSVLETTRI